ncbi:MAG: outer rane chaperone Skp (OmpH) [Firmicutes bacterium]|nr:outer rane chaperone Skp (OmpH) [Bacillota bacterium]
MLNILSKKRSLIIGITAAVLTLGAAGITVSQGGTIYAAASSSTVGYVDMQLLTSKHPDTAKANATMQSAIDQAKKDFDAKTKTMNAKQKKDYYTKLQQELNAKQQELFKPITEKVNEAIKKVAESKGIKVVIEKNAAIYGGQDITADVAKSF